MPQWGKQENRHETASKAADGFDWFDSNFVNPLVNTMCIEPANVVTTALGKFAGQSQHKIEALPVATVCAENWTAEMICQSVASAAGSVVPYALAGRLVSNTMRFAGAAVKAEGALATLAQSEKVAQIVGGGLYDGLKETHGSETHLRNGLAGAANFAVLEYWKTGSKGNLFSRSAERILSGASGSFAHIVISQPQFFTADTSEKLNLSKLMLTGGLMNALLPGTQEGLRLIQDRASTRMGWGVSIDRYVQKNAGLASFQSLDSHQRALFEKNRWARIEPDAQFDSYLSGKDLVTLTEGSSAKTLFHELQHRKESLSSIAEPGFVRAAVSLKNGDVKEAWTLYSSIRLAQEIRAELAARPDLAVASKAEAVKKLKKTIPLADAIGGVSYLEIWRREFNNFVRTGGQFRPSTDYSQCRFNREIREQANMLHFRLSGENRHADKVIDDVIDRTDLKDEQVVQVFRHVNEFLNPRLQNAVQLPLGRLAMQTLRLTANPEKVVQGQHPTCGPAALEYCTYVKHPENAANLISQVARTGKFVCSDGATIVMNGLNIIPEIHWGRRFANQLFQTTAVNVHWQRKSDLMPWLPAGDGIDNGIVPGAVRYQRFTTDPKSSTAYRLLDFSKKPAARVHERLPEQLQDDLSDPLMDNDSLNDMHRQINGVQHGKIALPWQLPSLRYLERNLRIRQLKDRLPVITTVDVRHPIFNYEFDSMPENGWHFVAVRSYERESKLVSIFNPWGHILHGVSTSELYMANKEFKNTPVK